MVDVSDVMFEACSFKLVSSDFELELTVHCLKPHELLPMKAEHLVLKHKKTRSKDKCIIGTAAIM